MSDTTYYFEDKYRDPYIDKCMKESGYGDSSSYKEFLQNCFCNLQNDINNRDSYYRGYYAPGVYQKLAQQCIAEWTNQYKDMLSPILNDIQANADAASTAEASSINEAIQARNAGINAGMGKSRAGLLGDATSNTNYGDVYRSAYNSSIQNQGSTQADYLNKMGQVTGAACCAKNMQTGAALNTMGAALQGAGSGASLGMSMGGR